MRLSVHRRVVVFVAMSLAFVGSVAIDVLPAVASTNTLIYAANNGGSILVWPNGTSGNVAPSVTFNGGAGSPGAMVFDRSGDLWEAGTISGQVVEYTALQIASGSAVLPSVVITTGLTQAWGIAFDSAGNLWVSSLLDQTIIGFTPTQIAASGSPAPAKTVIGLDKPAGLAFDSSGNMWVCDYGASTIDDFTPSQLATGGALTPTVTISGTVVSPIGSTFDSSGNLWVVSATGALMKFTPSQLAAGGAQIPTVTITTPGTSFEIAFDSSGDLWGTTSFIPASIYEFTPSQLAVSGAPTPAATIAGISTTLSSPAGIAIRNQTSSSILALSPTGVILTESTNPITVGQSVTITASVLGSSPTGPVDFYVDGSLVATQSINGNGVAAYSTSQLNVGSHSVLAAYRGDMSNAASASGFDTELVNAAPTTTSPTPTIVPATVTKALTPALSVISSHAALSSNKILLTFYCANGPCSASGTLSVARVASEKPLTFSHVDVADTALFAATGNTRVSFPLTSDGKTILAAHPNFKHFHLTLVISSSSGRQVISVTLVS